MIHAGSALTINFLLARLHRGRLADILTDLAILGPWPPEPLLAVCPRCGLEYFADVAHPDESVDWEWVEGAALLRLHRECPDHAAGFTVNA